MRASAARRCALALAALAGCAGVQAAPFIKPSVPLELLPAGSTNGTKADAFQQGKSTVFPTGPQVSVPLNPLYDVERNMGPVLPWSDPRIGKTVPGCAPEQVHLTWWGTQDSAPSVLVSWATCDLGAKSYVDVPIPLNASMPVLPPQDTSAATSIVRLGLVPGVYDKAFEGVAASYTVDNSETFLGLPYPGGVYISPIIHHTLLKDLMPGKKYFYKIENPAQLPGGTVEGAPFYGSFKVPGGFPLRLAVGADSGTVSNVTQSIAFVEASKPDAMLLTGDLTYADQYKIDPGSCFTQAQCDDLRYYKVNTFSPRWDAFGRLLQPLASTVPFMTAVGNHEPEMTPPYAEFPEPFNYWSNDLFFTRFPNLLARYPVPQTKAQALNGPAVADLAAITPDDTDQGRGLYYVSVLPGTATIITLSSYTYNDEYLPSDPMFGWLKNVLARVDRVKTPWLIVQMHAGFYTTGNHFMEASCMQILYEPLFRLYNVDIVFNGHDHNYERAGPMYNYKLDPECGTSFITVGSFGTNEEITKHWVDQYQSNAKVAFEARCPPHHYSNYHPPSYVPTADGQWGANGRCVLPKIAATGLWCPSTQPEYSRWRQHAYGVGMLDFISPKKAVWAFYSQEGEMAKPLDEIVITRADADVCALTPETQAAAATTGVSVDSVLASSKQFNVSAGIDAVKVKLNVSALGAHKNVSVNAVGAGIGLAQGGTNYVQAKVSAVQYSLNALALRWANKTGNA